jgi:hypothetical protein
MDIIFACTVFQVSSDLQFKSEFSEQIQINELNLLAIANTGMERDQPWVDPVPYFLRDDLIHYF